MASEQDKVFAQKALDLARMAANAMEEAEQYCDGIQDEDLRKQTEDEVERRLER